MRFMSSSKKPMYPGVPHNKSRERLLLLDHQPGLANDVSAEVSHPLSNFTGKSESHQSELNRRQIFTDIDSPCIDRSECFGSSHGALGSVPNSKYLWGLNSNLWWSPPRGIVHIQSWKLIISTLMIVAPHCELDLLWSRGTVGWTASGVGDLPRSLFSIGMLFDHV